MTWKRRWGIVTALALAQAGAIVWYQGFFSGTAAPAQPPVEEKKVIKPGPEAKKPAANADGPVLPSAEVPAPRPFVVPLEFTKGTAAAEKPSTAEPPLLPKELASVPTVPAPPPPPPPPAELSVKRADVAKPPMENNIIPAQAVEEKKEPPSDRRALSEPAPDVKPAVAVEVMPKPPEKLPDAPVPPPVTDPLASGKPKFTQTYAQGQKPPVPNAAPPAPPSVTPPVAPSPIPTPGVAPPIAPNPTPNAAPPAPLPPTTSTTPPPVVADVPCPWTLRVEIIKGRTLLTAQTGKEVQFRVSCDKLDVQSPNGKILASGNVKVESDGMTGVCEQLMIAWQADRVVLEGNAELQCRRDGQEMDLKAAKLSLRLTVSHRIYPVSTGARPGEVRGTTFLSRSKSARGDIRIRPTAGGGQTVIQPTSGNSDGGYDRYLGSEPPRRGNKTDE